jgi:hypothetical protein
LIIECARRADTPFHLRERSPDLDGQIPLRAARACPPLLAGNAFGLSIVVDPPIQIDRGLRSIATSHPSLSARSRGSEVVVAFDTGLEISHRTEATLAIGRAMNRRDRRVRALPRPVPSARALVIELAIHLARNSSMVLRSEVANIGAFISDPKLDLRRASDARDLLGSHATFFYEEYFRKKRGAPTGKYKRILATRSTDATDATLADDDPAIVVTTVGPVPASIARGDDRISALSIPVELTLALEHHGLGVGIAMRPELVRRRAELIERTMRDVLGDAATNGAIRYFTTYATAHAPGDPHFFLKPATLVASPADIRAVLDGPDGEGIEGMRGVTEPAWFHALPAVAEMTRDRATLAVGKRAVTVRFTRSDWLVPELRSDD